MLMKRSEYRLISFGSWRFFLSFLVVASHLWSGMVDGYAAYAVWGFFVLSGYLMTYVLRNKYGFEKEGLLSYAHNRFLRIMPMYWLTGIVGIFSIIVLTKHGINLTQLNPQFGLPQSGKEWLFPLTLLPVFPDLNLPVPVSSALGVEVGAYILIPFIAKNRGAAWLGLILSFLINYQYSFDISTFAIRYSDFTPCFIAFAAGSLAAHYIDQLRRFAAPIFSWTIWILHGLIWFFEDQWPWTYGLYFSVLLSVWVVVSMDSIKSSKMDKLLGDMSYPIYLLHTTVGGWLIIKFGYDRSFIFFLISFVMTLLLSWLFIKIIDKPLQKNKKPAVIKEVLNPYSQKLSN